MVPKHHPAIPEARRRGDQREKDGGSFGGGANINELSFDWVSSLITIIGIAVAYKIGKSQSINQARFQSHNALNMHIIKIISIILAVLIIMMGFYIGAKDNNFLLNFLAEIAGLALSVYIAIFIVDSSISKLKDDLKKEMWSKTRKHTYESLSEDLFLLLFNIYIKLPISALYYANPYDPSELAIYNEKILKELPVQFNIFLGYVHELSISSKTDVDTDEGLIISREDVIRILTTTFEDIQLILDEIRNIKILRLIQSSADQEIIDSLSEFDRSIDLYLYNIRNFKKECINGNLLYADATAKSMEALIEKTLNLYPSIKNEMGVLDITKKRSPAQTQYERILWILTYSGGRLEKNKLKSRTGMSYALVDQRLIELGQKAKIRVQNNIVILL